jgi:putative methionine-R-sulfoxide reductase with GAF domain
MLKAIFDTSMHASQVRRNRAWTVYVLSTSFVVVFTIYLLIANWDLGVPMLTYITENPTDPFPIAVVLFYVFSFVTYIVNRAGYVDTAAWLLLVVWVTGAMPLDLFASLTIVGLEAPVVLMMTLGTLLHGRRGLAVTLGLTLLYAIPIVAFAPDDQINFWTELAIYITAAVLFLLLIERATRFALREEGAEARAFAAEAAEAISSINRLNALRPELQTVTDEAIRVVLELAPDVYHAQIFLTDERLTTARLAASTGSVGQQMLREAHALAVGSQSVIGQTTLQNLPVIAEAGAPGTIHRPNPLLPETQVEAAFPLRAGGRVIGALDLQSRQRDAFTEADKPVYQAIADSIALAINGVREYEAAQARERDTARLAEERERALSSLEALSRRDVAETWQRFLRSNFDESRGLEIETVTGLATAIDTWSPAMTQAMADDDIATGDNTIAVPLRLRGNVIGVIELELDDPDALTDIEFQTLEEISDRFGIVSENVRLLYESQFTAVQEALINQFSNRLRTQTDVEDTLIEAVNALTDIFDARQVRITLGQPDETAAEAATEARSSQ